MSPGPLAHTSPSHLPHQGGAYPDTHGQCSLKLQISCQGDKGAKDPGTLQNCILLVPNSLPGQPLHKVLQDLWLMPASALAAPPGHPCAAPEDSLAHVLSQFQLLCQGTRPHPYTRLTPSPVSAISPGCPLHGELWNFPACTHFSSSHPTSVVPAQTASGF